MEDVEAADLIAMLHGKTLRFLAARSGMHFAGLAVAARHKAFQFSSSQRRGLANLDAAFAVTRHITQTSANRYLNDIGAHVENALTDSDPEKNKQNEAEQSTSDTDCGANSDPAVRTSDPPKNKPNEAEQSTSDTDGCANSDPAVHTGSAPGGSPAAATLSACDDLDLAARTAELERQLATQESRVLALLCSLSEDKTVTSQLMADLKAEVYDNVALIVGDSQAKLGESLKTDLVEVVVHAFDGKFDLIHSTLIALKNKLNETEHRISELRRADEAPPGLLPPATQRDEVTELRRAEGFPAGLPPPDTQRGSSSGCAASAPADGSGTADAESAASLWQRLTKATELKLRGNEKLKENTKTSALDAVDAFTAGLEVKCRDDVLNAQLYGNRAHVRINKLLQYDEALKDCSMAIQLDPQNVKNYWRAAKASICLELHADAVEFCERGLAHKADDDDLWVMRETARELYQSRRYSCPDGATTGSASTRSGTSADPGGRSS